MRPGDGITQSFMDYADNQGKQVSPTRAYEIFQHAQREGLINADNLSNISTQNVTGGVGFTGAGQTRMSPVLRDFLNEELNRK